MCNYICVYICNSRNDNMKGRILEFLKAENKSSAQFAEEIGVQPSGVSHILSGRNNPSLDFIMKLLDRYKYVSVEWLLFGKGTMYKDGRMQSLFDQDMTVEKSNEKERSDKNVTEKGKISENLKNFDETNLPVEQRPLNVARIVWFYEDNSFEEFYPRK